MKVLTTAALLGAIALGSAAVGCKNHHKHDEHDEAHITMNEVPAKVRDGFRAAYPNVTVKEIEREVYPDGTIHYEFKYVGADGTEKEVEFDKDGKELGEH